MIQTDIIGRGPLSRKEGKAWEESRRKILGAHLVSGRISVGNHYISIDQTLFHDATGTMAALQ
jgi:hypothetical protein